MCISFNDQGECVLEVANQSTTVATSEPTTIYSFEFTQKNSDDLINFSLELFIVAFIVIVVRGLLEK